MGTIGFTKMEHTVRPSGFEITWACVLARSLLTFRAPHTGFLRRSCIRLALSHHPR